MALIKGKEDIELLHEGGKRLARIMERVVLRVEAGITTDELNTFAEEEIRKEGDIPSFLNYRPRGARTPYPKTLCISVNDEVVHGIPGKRVLSFGDVVGLDLVLSHDERFVDMALTVPVGEVSDEEKRLITATRDALYLGIASARPGKRIGAISHAVYQHGKKFSYGVVRELGGHGVGHTVHEEPYIPNFGEEDEGTELRPGMVLAIEPMFNLGSEKVIFMPDGYTVKTRDGSKSAHFEHTILITENEPEILTRI